ncbi:MAG TPA: hypothetical protein VF231_02110, partial [Candidatus Limnocylindrales bacterium]
LDGGAQADRAAGQRLDTHGDLAAAGIGGLEPGDERLAVTLGGGDPRRVRPPRRRAEAERARGSGTEAGELGQDAAPAGVLEADPPRVGIDAGGEGPGVDALGGLRGAGRGDRRGSEDEPREAAAYQCTPFIR